MLNYVNRVIVGDSDGAVNTGATLATLTRGDILVLSEDMAVLSAGASKQSFYVAVGTGFAESPFIMSAKINPNFAKTSIKDTRAAADQVATLAALDAPTAGDAYQVIIAFKDRQRLIANKQSRIVMDYTSITGDDEYSVASALAGQAQWSSPYADPYGVRVDVTGVTGTVTVADNTATVTKGSKVVTFATAATHDTGTAIAVGDVLAFDNISYKVVSVASLVITLDRAFQAASEAAFTAADIDVIKAVTAAGMTVTGIASPKNNSAIDIYEKPVFEVGGTANIGTVAATTAMDLGQGIARQIKEAEFAAQGYLGVSNLRDWPADSLDYHAVDGVAYDQINIVSQDEHEGDLQNQMKSPVGLTLAFADAGSNAQRDAVDAIIEDVLGITLPSWT
jgi:hypothetical protein